MLAVPWTVMAHDGQTTYTAGEEPRDFVTVPGGEHTDAPLRPGPQYRRRLVDFYRAALVRQPGAPQPRSN
jgi:hypothetical protein